MCVPGDVPAVYQGPLGGYPRVCQRGGAAGEEELDREALIGDNEENLRQCRERGLEYILIDKDYQVNWEPKESRELKL